MKNTKSFSRILALVLALAMMISTATVKPTTAAAATKKVVALTVTSSTGAILYEGQKLTKTTLKEVVTVKALYNGAKKAKKITSYTCSQVGKVIKPSAGKFKLTVKAGGKNKSVKVPVAKLKSLKLSANGFTLAEGATFKPSQFKARAKVTAKYAGGASMAISTYKVEVLKVTSKKVTLRATYGNISSNKVTIKFVAKATDEQSEPTDTTDVPSTSDEPTETTNQTQTPAQNTPSQNTPTQNTPSQNTPAQNTPSQNTPASSTTPSSSTVKSYTITVNSPSNNVKINGRALAFSNGKASETFPAGTTVTLAATDSNSSRFIRWASAGAELSSSKTFNFTVNSNISINAVFENVYTLTVKRVGGKGRATLAGESLDFYNNVATVNLVPGTYMLTAVPTDDYHFISITDENGKILSKQTTYTVGLSTNKTVIINFAEAEKTVTVTYTTPLGEVLKSEAVAFGETLAPSNNVVRSGYDFKGWKLGNNVYYGNAGDAEFYATGGAKLSDAIKAQTAAKNPVTVQAYYEEKPVQYHSLTLKNGTVVGGSVTNGSAAHNEHIYVQANAAPAGMKFEKWLANGAEVSQKPNYDFFILGDTNLEAVYVSETKSVEAKPTVAFTGSKYSVNNETKTVTFTLSCEVPASCTLVEWGFVLSTKGIEPTQLNVEGNGTKKAYDGPMASHMDFTKDITNTSIFDNHRRVTAIAYVIYTDANGSHTLYSDNYCDFTL